MTLILTFQIKKLANLYNANYFRLGNVDSFIMLLFIMAIKNQLICPYFFFLFR